MIRIYANLIFMLSRSWEMVWQIFQNDDFDRVCFELCCDNIYFWNAGFPDERFSDKLIRHQINHSIISASSMEEMRVEKWPSALATPSGWFLSWKDRKVYLYENDSRGLRIVNMPTITVDLMAGRTFQFQFQRFTSCVSDWPAEGETTEMPVDSEHSVWIKRRERNIIADLSFFRSNPLVLAIVLDIFKCNCNLSGLRWICTWMLNKMSMSNESRLRCEHLDNFPHKICSAVYFPSQFLVSLAHNLA